jgi:hypothetical protein
LASLRSAVYGASFVDTLKTLLVAQMLPLFLFTVKIIKISAVGGQIVNKKLGKSPHCRNCLLLYAGRNTRYFVHVCQTDAFLSTVKAFFCFI